MAFPLRRVLVFACAHALVTLCMMLYAFSATSAEFDNPDLPRSPTAKAARIIAETLSQPLGLVWTAWASKNLPYVEWVLFLANSSLWGLLIVAATGRLSGRRR